MNKTLLTAPLLALALTAQAQTHIRIWQAGDSNRMKIANVGEMTFSGETVSIKGKTYNTADIDSIIVVPEITVAYNGASASVSIPDAVASQVTASVDGAHVTITNTNEANEMEFILSGQSDDGSLTYNGSYKCTIELAGLSLASKRGAAMDIQCGKRIALVVDEGTANSLADCTGGAQKACLYAKGHIEMEGGGTLNVTGNTNHAISTKEYLQLKKSTGTLNILASANDAIHAGQYFQLNGGTVNVTSSTLGDAIQVEALDDPSKDNDGQAIIKGGTLLIDVAGEDCKGLKVPSTVTVTGGTLRINANGNGSRGIQTDGDMTISEDDNATLITIAANGNLCTLAEDVSDPHRCMGMKIDGNLTIDAGTVTVTNTGNKSRGIKVGGKYTRNGGTVEASITN